jgi:hypothetical protein
MNAGLCLGCSARIVRKERGLSMSETIVASTQYGDFKGMVSIELTELLGHGMKRFSMVAATRLIEGKPMVLLEDN